ncbi:glycosyltransferase family 2 protein [Wielerella bovis]|uniref:glycosyltransferase family 2 protein n=1 Tax=Wielerella bovis TaxID=2917790 RepID=UPI003D2C3D5E
MGRPELERAIQSVAAQTYPCTHYVFVDGEQYADAAREILTRYPHVKAVYLPVNTGANGWYNSYINAAASFIAQEDIICFLDDDNWYREDHVASVVETFEQSGADYVYTLRNLYTPQQEFICQDNLESLGDWACLFYQQSITLIVKIGQQNFSCTVSDFNCQFLVDANCFALHREVAHKIALHWCEQGFGNDKIVYSRLKECGLHGITTGKYTVNYIAQKGFSESNATFFKELLRALNQAHIQAYGGRPWAKE